MGRREEENRLFNTHIKCIVQKPHTPCNDGKSALCFNLCFHTCSTCKYILLW